MFPIPHVLFHKQPLIYIWNLKPCSWNSMSLSIIGFVTKGVCILWRTKMYSKLDVQKLLKNHNFKFIYIEFFKKLHLVN
jgi:hypothetical protein